MGSRGPIRAISGTRAIQSSRAARKKPKIKVPEGNTPSIPPWLPPEARPFWKRIVPQLSEAGVVLQKIDGEAVGMYCLSLWQASEAALAAQTTSDEALKIRFLAKSAAFGQDALRWASAIGATPAARARLNIKPLFNVEDDPWEAL